MTKKIMSLEERLFKHRKISESGCWLWTSTITSNGYGRTQIGSRAGGIKREQVYVHRTAFILWKGPIPEGLDLDHLCRVRNCFNPDHLEPVTRSENTLRGDGPALLSKINGSKTHCIKGHPFSEENTRIRPNGGRTCVECSRDRGTGKPRQRFKDQCPHGHPYNEENTGKTNNGSRYCKECNRIRAREYQTK